MSDKRSRERVEHQTPRAEEIEPHRRDRAGGDRDQRHAPPFPGEGEPAFDLVLSSGVVSFAPDADAWFDGLLATVRPGGTLVVADIHRDACGMRARRASKPLLPVRELNALSRAEALASLEARA